MSSTALLLRGSSWAFVNSTLLEQHTLRATGSWRVSVHPIVTNASVLAIKYKDGVMVAADTMISYGSMAFNKNVKRMAKIGDYTLLASSGEYSDFQHLVQILNERETEDWVHEDNTKLSPSEYASYLGRTMYNRRSKMNPLYNQLVVSGYKNQKPYLAYVDMYGTAYEENFVATGYGMYFCMGLLRGEARPDMPESEARALLEKCMRILFYRETRASNRIQIGTATSKGVTIEDPVEISHHWDFQHWLKPSSAFGTVGTSW